MTRRAPFQMISMLRTESRGLTHVSAQLARDSGPQPARAISNAAQRLSGEPTP
jgi:hypothetical protein